MRIPKPTGHKRTLNLLFIFKRSFSPNWQTKREKYFPIQQRQSIKRKPTTRRLCQIPVNESSMSGQNTTVNLIQQVHCRLFVQQTPACSQLEKLSISSEESLLTVTDVHCQGSYSPRVSRRSCKCPKSVFGFAKAWDAATLVNRALARASGNPLYQVSFSGQNDRMTDWLTWTHFEGWE